MYGTVARLRVKPGHAETLMALGQQSPDQEPPPGFVATYVFKTDRDPNEYTLVVLFQDRDSYHTNAARPEQDQQYRQMREHLETDPEWIDGEVIYTTTSQ